MKRASYKDAVDWVAQNDSGGDADAHEPEVVQWLITAVLVADIFDVPTLKVGQDVVKRRAKLKALDDTHCQHGVRKLPHIKYSMECIKCKELFS